MASGPNVLNFGQVPVGGTRYFWFDTVTSGMVPVDAEATPTAVIYHESDVTLSSGISATVTKPSGTTGLYVVSHSITTPTFTVGERYFIRITWTVPTASNRQAEGHFLAS